jgi:magnesium-transporting ATPase (P-type)
VKQNFEQIATEEALSALGSQLEGLSANEAVTRLSKNGKNELPAPKTETIFQIFLRQFNSPLIYVLVAAAIIIFFINDLTDCWHGPGR